MLVVREFELKDLSRVHEIERKSFKDPYPVLVLLNLYEHYSDTFLVAEKDGYVVGYLIARPVNKKGHILALATDPCHRRRGVGRTLMEAVSGLLLRKGATELWLEVRASNREAVQFYKARSFFEVGRAFRYYADGEDAIVLKRKLEASPLMPLFRTGEATFSTSFQFP